MLVPLQDNNPLVAIRFQVVTVAIISLNVGIFLMTYVAGGEQVQVAAAFGYGLVPGELFAFHQDPAGSAGTREGLTLVTYAFLHGGWMHLIGNMLFLWVFGDNVEDSLGHGRFVVFYLACAAAAGLAHAVTMPGSDMPLIGASGAVAGVLGAYMVLHPRAHVWVLLFWRLPLKLPAMYVLGAWIAMQVVSLLLTAADDVHVAWWAHIGGFAAGVALVLVMRRRAPLAT